jgi:hypothetical protein
MMYYKSMKTYFNLHTNGKTYKVAVRGGLRHVITCEKKLRSALMNAALKAQPAQLSENLVAKIEADKIHEVCHFFGWLAYSSPIEN